MTSTTHRWQFSLLALLVLAIAVVPTAAGASEQITVQSGHLSEPAQPAAIVAVDPVFGADRTGVSDAAAGDAPGVVAEHRSQPYVSGAHDGDAHGDGVYHQQERAFGPTVATADSDGDGLQDGYETRHAGTNPTNADTDDDGLGDGDETYRATDPTSADTDGDGLTDGAEVTRTETNPTLMDSDGDVLSDGQEWHWGVDSPIPSSTATLPGVVVGFAVGCAVATATLLGILVGGRRVRARLEHVPFAGTLFEAYGPTRSTRAFGSDSAAGEPVNGRDGTDGRARPDEQALPDEQFLPDEYVVQRVLEGSGGRMKQSTIVEATEWSKSKVSRLLSSMANDGDVVKIRLGRENLVCLQGHEPDILKGTGGA